VQALTEAIKLVPNAILLASLPESDIEAGSNRGMTALQALERPSAGCRRSGSQSRLKRLSRSSDDDSSNQFEMPRPATLYAEPLLTPT